MMRDPNPITRRQLIQSMMGGSLLMPAITQQLLAAEDPLAARASHFPAKAKNVIFLFLTGGVSHVDTFDPKSQKNGRDGNGKDKLLGCIFPYRADRKTGIETSDLFPHVRSCMKDVCVIRSMESAHFDHSEAALGMHTCSATFARPCLGSWVSYGLGTMNQNLPSFMVIAPKLPYGGTQVFSNDFLPATHQGTRIYPGKDPIPNLKAVAKNTDGQKMELDFARRLNQKHLESRRDDSALSARMKTFETAYRMQMAGPEAFDLTQETTKSLDLYGMKPGQTTGFGWQCLMARRLVERGVRFIELVHMGSDSGVNWDAHSDMLRYKKLAPQVDQPIAALLKDLKARGMLEETLVVLTTEFGRTPMKDGKYGRHHHGKAFSILAAGGGIKGGHVHGRTDDRGYNIVEDRMEVYDLHATILHQLGMDHEKLTYRHAGRDFRLTDVHGRVVKEILA